MNYPKYDLSTSTDIDIFEFVSTGVKGDINKVIQFERTSKPGLFNLAFGDKKTKIVDGVNIEYIDDQTISENGDRDQVLATVAAATYEYTSAYPDRNIVFSGSSPVKTRLYRMAISKNYEELSQDYEIFGIIAENSFLITVPFHSNTKFEGYLVKRKTTLRTQL